MFPGSIKIRMDKSNAYTGEGNSSSIRGQGCSSKSKDWIREDRSFLNSSYTENIGFKTGRWSLLWKHSFLIFFLAELSWSALKLLKVCFSQEVFIQLKAPYSSKIDILLSKKGLINWYTCIALIQS